MRGGRAERQQGAEQAAQEGRRATVDAALVASGTATLECGLAETPMAVIYKMNELRFKLAKRLVKIDSVSLVNLVAGEKIIKEFIQYIDAKEVAAHLRNLVDDKLIRGQAIEQLKQLQAKVIGNPHQQTASLIGSHLENHYKNRQLM